MSEFVDVAKADEILPGTAVAVEANGVEIAVVNVAGQFYALAGECPHAGGPLGDGDLVDDYALECPLHGSIFDVRSGEALQGPADEPVITYDTVVQDGVVKVALE